MGNEYGFKGGGRCGDQPYKGMTYVLESGRAPL